MDTEKQEQTEYLDSAVKKKEKRSIWSEITLEPMWFGTMASCTMSFIGFKSHYLYKACTVDFGHSFEECYNRTNDLEKESQLKISEYMIYPSAMGGIMTTVLMLFLGPWSDLSGRRKPLIMLPIVGMILTSILLLILQCFPNVPALMVVYISIIPMAIAGNLPMLMMAAFNYLGDICYKTGKSTTMLMGRSHGFIAFFSVVGSLGGPPILNYLGFTGLYSISLLLEISALMCVYYLVKDVNIAKLSPRIFDWRSPLNALKCVFKPRKGQRRRNIILMIIVPCFNTVTLITDMSITFMYARQKFMWTEYEFGYYIASKGLLGTLGTIIILFLFKKRFKMADTKIGVIGGIFQSLSYLVFMFCHNQWMIILVQLIYVLSRGVMIAERPVLNKQIHADEQGKVICITGIFEKVVSTVTIPVSNYIYMKTLYTFPAAYMILAVIAGLVQTLCFLLVKEDKDEINLEN